MKSFLYITITAVVGASMVLGILKGFPAPWGSFGWWWEVIWGTFAIGMGSYEAIYTTRSLDRTHYLFSKFGWLFQKNSVNELKEPHTFFFYRAMGIVFVAIGLAFLFRSFFMPTLEEWCAHYQSEVHEGTYEKCIAENT